MLPLLVQAANWPPYEMPYTPGDFPLPMPPTGSYNFRIQTPNNSRNVEHLDYSEFYSYGQLTPRVTAPQFEVTANNHRPYVRENVILILRVISSSSVERMDPVLPQTQTLSFQVLHNPIASNTMVNGQPQIINEMRYMATPLVSGPVDLQFSVNLTISSYTGQHNTNVTVSALQKIHLQVQSQVPNVTPWLPLEQLALSSNMNVLPEVVAGEAIELVVKLIAAGALGNQLPNLERLLKAEDLRVYRGKTEWEGGPSEDFRHIMGVRTEHYTLVPQYNGTLRLPPIRIQWFNVRTATPESSALTTNATASINSDANVNSVQLTWTGSILGWVIMSLVMLLMLGIGYWIGIGYRNPWQQLIILNKLFVMAHPQLMRIVAPLWQKLKRLSLRPYLMHFAYRWFNTLPIAIRFWFWVRTANIEVNPISWRNRLQFLSWRAIAHSPYITSPDLAERIVRFQSSVNSDALKRLLKNLDAAIYGNQALDFERWKYEFVQQIRPNLLSLLRGFLVLHSRQPRLPTLNPSGVHSK